MHIHVKQLVYSKQWLAWVAKDVICFRGKTVNEPEEAGWYMTARLFLAWRVHRNHSSNTNKWNKIRLTLKIAALPSSARPWQQSEKTFQYNSKPLNFIFSQAIVVVIWKAIQIVPKDLNSYRMDYHDMLSRYSWSTEDETWLWWFPDFFSSVTMTLVRDKLSFPYVSPMISKWNQI